MRVLVTGGARSGKSRHAESLLSGFDAVTYVAPGPTTAEDPDPDWAARIAAHRVSRPRGWTTLETRDLAAALSVDGPILVDCLGTWLAGTLDERGLWDESSATITQIVTALLADAVTALEDRDDVVLVTNEVGLGVVPDHRSGRLFRDLLGLVNQQVATACDQVHLVVAGRVLTL
ncbi:bifunctional adenosylcobinamide kinase/adenosylcobinamide-phosphate guanylyltransferase [Nocardioides terrisoli]|uniref:bifunctional adenosylcobinamide kinase/adenosylcobinamide-phosphate guanylyltransferase n=1 Tax=Nocardioides terrisoli TaxID=3388267 RepID=UPI00287BA5AD|nr:bifunctional adenosylcobinamide kinase/adenosylcobinamide-phosphate guanylyltransferase [Nocardioides marmorisolisilvae]